MSISISICCHLVYCNVNLLQCKPPPHVPVETKWDIIFSVQL
jgi:hypothetical protein